MLFCETGTCLTKTEAIELSKLRIATLAEWAGTFGGECFMNEEHCGVEGKSQTAILNYMRHEANKFQTQISYSSGDAEFFIDGAVRIAKTGNDWGSPIIFNEDLLSKEQNGDYSAVGFFETLGILIHELGHHQNQMLAAIGLPQLEHSELDTIAMHAVTYLQDRTRKISITSDDVPGLKKDDELSIYFIDREWDPGIRQIWGQIFVDSRSGVAEVSEQIALNLQCPVQYQDGRISFKGKPKYASFRKISAPEVTSTASEITIEQKVGSSSVLCVDEFMNRYDIFSGYENGLLKFNFSLSSGQITLKNGSFSAARPTDGQE